MLGFQTILISCATAGAVITYGMHRLSGKRSERAELLSEICEERESLRRVMAALPEQLVLARRSKMAAAEITGYLTSDATGRWLSELEADLADAKTLEAQLPAAEVQGADQSGMELDLRLVEILALSIRVNRLADKYSLSSPSLHIDPELDQLELHQPEMLPEPPRALESSLSAVAP